MRLLCALSILAIAVFISCGKAEKPYRTGLVNFVSGTAFIVGAQGSETPAKPGMPIDINMKVKTIGAKSICEIYFNDNVLKVFGDSMVSVEWLTFNQKTGKDESVLVLNNGRIFGNVKRKLAKDDTFIVKTPTCVAAVRGTEFFVSDNGKNSNVSCLDGKVEVQDRQKKGSPAVISDKEESSVVKGKPATKKTIEAKQAKKLEEQSEVKPLSASNRQMFDKLEDGDSAAVKSVKKSIEKISGSAPDKKKKPDVDLFFFQM